MTITKNFVEIYVAADCEGRRYEWVGTNETYEEAVVRITTPGKYYMTDGVRIAEKTFNADTFEITTRTVKETRSIFRNGGRVWEETVA
jgi:hypothetical protein